MPSPRLLVFASGSKDGGGSGFQRLVEASRSGELCAEIVAVVSNHSFGGVREKADKLKVSFIPFPKIWNREDYLEIVRATGADFVALSGWLKLVSGLDSRTTFNIHPGPLPKFGGPGMYGHHVHEAVMTAFQSGKLTHSAVSMHFVTTEYDRGPVFFRHEVPILPDDTPDTLGKRVNAAEHQFQPMITDMVVRSLISWDGVNRNSLRVPPGYSFLPTG